MAARGFLFFISTFTPLIMHGPSSREERERCKMEAKACTQFQRERRWWVHVGSCE